MDEESDQIGRKLFDIALKEGLRTFEQDTGVDFDHFEVLFHLYMIESSRVEEFLNFAIKDNGTFRDWIAHITNRVLNTLHITSGVNLNGFTTFARWLQLVSFLRNNIPHIHTKCDSSLCFLLSFFHIYVTRNPNLLIKCIGCIQIKMAGLWDNLLMRLLAQAGLLFDKVQSLRYIHHY